jgi:hypothetical protein
MVVGFVVCYYYFCSQLKSVFLSYYFIIIFSRSCVSVIEERLNCELWTGVMTLDVSFLEAKCDQRVRWCFSGRHHDVIFAIQSSKWHIYFKSRISLLFNFHWMMSTVFLPFLINFHSMTICCLLSSSKVTIIKIILDSIDCLTLSLFLFIFYRGRCLRAGQR